MATDPAPRRLWQVPTFLTGLAGLVALWYGGDTLRPSLHERHQRAMHALRPAVDKTPPDADQVAAALRKVPPGEPPADLLPQVKFLTGSAYVALAEANPTAAEAADWWASARRDLEAAEPFDRPAAEDKKLRYRLARAWANTPGSDTARTIEALTKHLSAGDDPAEGYRLLARLFLASTPSNEPLAREALQNYLRHVSSRADARTLNDARVKLAGLHAKLGDRDEAMKVLDRVGPDAPSETFAAARLLASTLHGQAADWPAAVRGWEQVRDMKGATESQRAEALERLGEAYAKVGRSADAAGALREVTNTDGPAGRAAWFKKADAAVQDPSSPTDAAVIALEKALIGPADPAFTKLVPNAECRRVCEAAFARAKGAGDFASAVRVAHAYGKVAEQGNHHRLTAEAYEAWAATSSADESKERRRLAAESFVAASRESAVGPQRLDFTRRAAMLYLKAGERAKGLSLLAEYTNKLKDDPSQGTPSAWAEAGEAYLEAGDKESARKAFSNAGGDDERAVLRLAELTFEADPSKGATDTATLERLASEPGADPAARERAMFLLGEMHLMQKEWAKAEARLKAALEAHPKSERAARGRYQYGQVLRHGAYDAARSIKSDRAVIDQIKAEREAARKPGHRVEELIKIEDRIDASQKTYDDLMRRAFEEFRQAEELFLASPTTADADALKRSSFWAADCCYWLGDFEACAARCEKLAMRFRGRIEELEALRDLVRCCKFAAEASREAKDPDAGAAWTRRAAATAEKAKQSLAAMPATAFDGTTESRTKAHWQQWVDTATGD